jgi:hypothetical protein
MDPKSVVILRTLVGSQAHGLATPTSDIDYRAVFLLPTSEHLKLGGTVSAVDWKEGEQDNTAYEIGHFLHLALQSNPSILEVLGGPVEESNKWGEELRTLLPDLWTSRRVLDSFTGYSRNQQKKFFEDKDGKTWKYAVAYARVLLLGIELLRHGTLTVSLEKMSKNPEMLKLSPKGWLNPEWIGGGEHPLELDEVLRMVKAGFVSKGMVVDWCESLRREMQKAYDANPNHIANQDKVNEFLLRLRRENW